MPHNAKSLQYVSTSQAAKILNLSWGTVQRMVDRGLLESFITEGRHRRILFRSLSDYCQSHGIEVDPDVAQLQAGICILHSPSHPIRGLKQLQKVPGVKFITDPLDLVLAPTRCELIFVDARIEWIDWKRLAEHPLSRKMRLYVYNSAHLSPPHVEVLQDVAQFSDSDISADLLKGYQLARQVREPQMSSLTH